MLQRVRVLLLACLVGKVASQEKQEEESGNVAFALSKGYLEQYQGFIRKSLLKGVDELALRDVRVQKKADSGRLTSLMKDITLAELDLERSVMTVDFTGAEPSSEQSETCITDFEVHFKLTGISMTFEFDQWLEIESNQVVEEWGMGQFVLPNMSFSLVAAPYLYQEKFRLKISEHSLQMGDFEYRLHTQEHSKFEGVLDKFSAVFAEHMRNQVNLDLSTKLASVVQKSAYGLFRRMQQQNKVQGRDILMNKHLASVCMVPGEPTRKDANGKVLKRGSGAISFSMVGSFHRSQDLLLKTAANDQQLSFPSPVPEGAMLVQIGKQSWDSLMTATFKEEGKVRLTMEPILMSVEDLEDMMEGVSTAFEEESEVKINAHIDKIFAAQFDQDFGNIAFRADITIDFVNPIEERMLLAQAKLAIKGTAEPIVKEDFHMTFAVSHEKTKMLKFTPFFQSETTLAEFEEEFSSVLQEKLLRAMNNKLGLDGVAFPLGTNICRSGQAKTSVHKDFLLLKCLAAPKEDLRHVLSRYSTYQPEKESQLMRSYPMVWTVAETDAASEPAVPPAEEGDAAAPEVREPDAAAPAVEDARVDQPDAPVAAAPPPEQEKADAAGEASDVLEGLGDELADLDIDGDVLGDGDGGGEEDGGGDYDDFDFDAEDEDLADLESFLTKSLS